MKHSLIFAAVAMFLFSIAAQAEVKNWDGLIAGATAEEKNNLGKLIQQIRMVPAKDPQSGKSVFKVVAVEKGSVFDRQGVRAGDLISAGSWGVSDKQMELSNIKKPDSKPVDKTQH